MNKNSLLLIVLIVFGVIFRVINNHFQLMNFNPTLAIALVAGMLIKDKRLALLSGLGVMLLTDVYFAIFTDIQAYYGLGQVFNYLAVVSASVVGILLKNTNAQSALKGSILSSLSFFVISNFGTWASGFTATGGHDYTTNFKGLVDCFAMAIPFYKSSNATLLFTNSFLSCLFFTPVILIAINAIGSKLLQKARN
jgi:hypothetical protein